MENLLKEEIERANRLLNSGVLDNISYSYWRGRLESYQELLEFIQENKA